MSGISGLEDEQPARRSAVTGSSGQRDFRPAEKAVGARRTTHIVI